MVVSILNTRHQTPVAKKTVNPVYAEKDAVFDYPLYLSLADKLGVVEFIVWDKDLMSKDYLGEVSLPLEDWFVDRANGTDRAFAFDDPGNQVRILYPPPYPYLHSHFIPSVVLDEP